MDNIILLNERVTIPVLTSIPIVDEKSYIFQLAKNNEKKRGHDLVRENMRKRFSRVMVMMNEA